jgi:hypothetical protein
MNRASMVKCFSRRPSRSGYCPLFDRRLWLFSGILALVVYRFELAHYTLSIDEELHSLWGRNVWLNWLRQGRWGMAFLVYSLPPLSIPPFLITLIFCAGLSTGAVLCAGHLVSDRREAYAFAAMFVSCPIWPHLGEFNTLSWGFGIGLTCCAFAISFIRIGGVAGVAASAALLAFSISIYQSLLLLFLAVAALHFACMGEAHGGGPGLRRPRQLGRLLSVAGSSAAGIAFYYAVNKTALYLSGAEMVYVQSWIRLAELVAPGGREWQRIAKRLSGLAFGEDPIYLGWGLEVLLLSWIGLLVTAWGILHQGGSAALRLKHAGIFVVATIIALAPVVVSAGVVAVRSLVALPAVYALFASRAFRLDRRWHAVPLALLGLAVAANVWISTSLFKSDQRARARDADLAASVMRRIEEVGRPRFGSSIPFSVAGKWSPQSRGHYDRVEIFGTSFFEHDGGNVWRVFAYMKLIGFEGLRPVKLSVIPEAVQRLEEMPTWPAPGSVAVVDDVVVVKFGGITPQQR